jgi:VWA domain-containing protein
MARRSGLLYASLLALGFACPAYTQEESCQHRILPLSLYDSSGRTIRGLRPSDFEAKYRKEPVKIISVAPDNRPHRVVILLDASGSMIGVWRQALAVASDLAETQIPNTQMALIIFNEKITEQIDFSAGQAAVARRLREILSDENYASKAVKGRTALFDSLLAGLQFLDNPTSTDSLYLVSDAGESFSHANLDRVTRRLTLSRVRLFLVAMFEPLGSRNRAPEELRGTRGVDALVRETGGETISPYRQVMPSNPKETAQIRGIMKDFYWRMTKNELVEIALPQSVDKQASWELKLSTESKKHFKGAEISYPTILAPCEP